MKPKRLSSLVLSLALSLGAAVSVQADEAPDMIDNMVAMQYFLHKLGLSLDAGHHELADFYAHELEETIEEAQKIETYHDHPIGELVTAMLLPPFEKLEDAVEENRTGLARSRFDEVVEACNACHAATGYEFIRIVPTDHNPFMQSFQPKD